MTRLKKLRLILRDDRTIDFETHDFNLPADQVEMEHRFGVGVKSLSDSPKVEWVLFLIFRAAVRELPEFAEISFETFVEDLRDYEMVGEGDIETLRGQQEILSEAFAKLNGEDVALKVELSRQLEAHGARVDMLAALWNGGSDIAPPTEKVPPTG